VTRYGGPVAVTLATQPQNPQPGAPFTITYTLKDKAGQPVTLDKLRITHEHPMHLIVVSQDLQHFSHIHPADQRAGSYAVTDKVPQQGRYLLFSEFFTADGTPQIERNELTTDSAPPQTGANLAPDMGRPQQVGELTATLTADVEKVRRRAPATFTLTFTKDGEPVADLEPYLGAPCHVVIISADTKQFAHTHGDVPGGAMSADMAGGSMADMSMPPPPPHFGPSVQFTHTFMQAGLYRVWVQVGYAGEVLTIANNVQVNK